MAGIFKTKGVYSMGFDMSPSGSLVFTGGGSAGGGNVGSANSSNTPFGYGYSWALNNQYSIINLGTNLTTLYKGIWVKLPALPSTNQRIFAFWDMSGTPAVQCNLRLYSDGHFQFCSGSGTTGIGAASSAGLITANVWCHLQIKVVIDPSAGVVELVVNDNGSHTKQIASTGLNTRSTANTWVSGVELNSVTTSGNTYFDDWWMLDGSAASPLNSYLGPVQVKGEKPSANSAVGGRNAWTPTNPQNDNHLNVGNIPANAAQYNYSQNPGDYDMFRFPSLGTASSVLFLNVWAVCGLDAGGSRTVKLNCYSGSTDSASAAITPNAIATPSFINEPYLVDPNTSSAWSVSNAEAAELGIKVDT